MVVLGFCHIKKKKKKYSATQARRRTHVREHSHQCPLHWPHLWLGGSLPNRAFRRSATSCHIPTAKQVNTWEIVTEHAMHLKQSAYYAMHIKQSPSTFRYQFSIDSFRKIAIIRYLYRNLCNNKAYTGVDFNLPFFDTSAPFSSFCASSILSKKNKKSIKLIHHTQIRRQQNKYITYKWYLTHSNKYLLNELFMKQICLNC